MSFSRSLFTRASQVTNLQKLAIQSSQVIIQFKRMSSVNAVAAAPDFAASATPNEDKIRWKINNDLNPAYFKLYNDSHKHAHHKPMVGTSSSETHFRLEIVSEAFDGKRLPARHRQVYDMFREEMSAEGGIHALQLLTLTPKEYENRQNRA
ncbi:bola protein [Lipomyces japonicus]|uniref:bola protein n=1 Tax=Lipomyces japonicus TaxID=56871 RepID=UPI0034CFABC8